MPKIDPQHIRVAFDMRGCPNACRHCWLGTNRTRTMSEDDIRWAVEQFRTCVRPGDHEPFVQKLTVATSFREPDYADDYRHFYELEQELSDEPPPRYELLSVWRLARDETYAPWAKSVGTTKCQISFFGLEETTDWFCRREGVFRDSITATERLYDAGILPRWQFFLTRKILPDVDGLMGLVDSMRLRERAAQTGGEFELFIHPPSPGGPQRVLEPLMTTVAECENLPDDLMESTRKHLDRDVIWRTEGELHREIMEAEGPVPWDCFAPDLLWFFVTPGFDVFTNLDTLEPWWRLGNLKADSLADIIARFENNELFALKTIQTVSPKEIVANHSSPESQMAFESRDDLIALCFAEYCEQGFRR